MSRPETIMTSGSYQYAKLEHGHIRILKLCQRSSANSKTIECQIASYALSSCPSYTALSYCWGNDDESKSGFSLLVDGSRIPVRKNLFAFLSEHMRRHETQANRVGSGLSDGRDPCQPDQHGDQVEGGRRYNLRRRKNPPIGSYDSGPDPLWVDAICINQSEDNEKNMQLPLIGNIYASAIRIIIWLGVGSDVHNFTALKSWQRMVLQHRLENENEQEGTGKYAMSEAELTALNFLGQQDYWRRVWVLQEASTPHVPRDIWCGSSCIPFDHAVLGNEAARQYVLSLGRIPSVNPWIPELENLVATERLRTGRGGTERHPTGPRLLDLLYRSRDLKATNPKDRVYALLPIYQDIQQGRTRATGTPASPLLVPDYSSSVESTYQQTATCILTVERDPRVLLLCSRYSPPASRYSWVPNFAKLPTFFSIFDCADKFSASGDLALHPTLRVTADGRELLFRGSHVDTVHRVHPPLAGEGLSIEQSATDVGYWQGNFTSWVQSVAGFLYKPDPESENGRLIVPEQRYPGGGSLSEAVDRVLALDCSPGLVMERATWSQSSGWSVAHWPFHEIAVGTAKPQRLSDKPALLSQFTDMLLRTGHGSLFWTKSGRIGLGDPGMRPGDLLVICHGLSVPIILRRISSFGWGDEWGPAHTLIGPCIVQGIMDGEAMRVRWNEAFKVI